MEEGGRERGGGSEGGRGGEGGKLEDKSTEIFKD